MVWRWREDSRPGDPDTNMAVDAALLQELIGDSAAPPIVRVYRWDRPSVSIGRLQDEATVRRAFPGLPLTRRPTGGRAVRHGADLTVAVAARESDLPLSVDHGVLSSYRQIVRGVVSAFGALGIAAHIGGGLGGRQDHAPVDCFARAASCDVVSAETGRKLAGCAQRRQGGVILQQMSIPLAGFADEAALVAALKAGLGEALGAMEWVRG